MLCGCSVNAGRPATGGGGAGVGVGGAFAAAGTPRISAASMSAFTMRPCGPLPLRRVRSMPACCAIRRASGLAKMRSPAAAGAGAAGTAAAAGCCAFGAGAAWAGATAGGAALGAPVPAFANAAASSPSSSRSATGWFTFTPWLPAGTRILPSLPSSTASTSIVALSVSISAMTSPAFTGSPSFFSHLARLPSVIVGDSAGMRISMGMSIPLTGPGDARSGAITDLARGGGDLVGIGQRQLLQVGGVRQRHVLAGHACDRRVQPVERLLHHDRRDLRTDAGEGPALLHRDDPVGLLHRFHDRGDVQRAQRAQIDHLGIDALARQLLGRRQREADLQREGGDRDVLAWPLDAGATDRQDELGIGRYREALAIEDFILQKHDRIGIADRRLQQSLGVRRR